MYKADAYILLIPKHQFSQHTFSNVLITAGIRSHFIPRFLGNGRCWHISGPVSIV